MIDNGLLTEPLREIENFSMQPNAYRSMIILFISIIAAYWLSRFLAKGIIKVAHVIATRSDSSTDEMHQFKLRRIETYLSVTIAIVRALTLAIVAFFAWQFESGCFKLNSCYRCWSAFYRTDWWYDWRYVA